MQLPHSLDNHFDPFVQVLPDDVEQKAYQLGAFSRARKIDSLLQLLHLIMLSPWRMLQQTSIEVQSNLLMLFPPKQEQLEAYLHIPPIASHSRN